MALRLNLGFSDYLESNIERFSKIKTLVNRDSPISFLSIYTEARLGVSAGIKSEQAFINQLLTERLIVLTGGAGCGKSMLMRRTFLRFLENSTGHIPIFVYLREIDVDKTNLLDFIFNELRIKVNTFTDSQFKYGLEIGKFLILLDGLDEVTPSQRSEISTQILALSRTYGSVVILCTSRPNEAFVSWNEFLVGEVEPFDRAQVEELIPKGTIQ